MPADKRIAVSEERWKELGKMKKAGQTYDQLIKELIQKANRLELAEKAKKVKNMDEDELSPLDIDE
jgi:predicted CopG family antitoxin